MPSNNTENILSTPFTEGTGNPIPASRISYDGTTSGLSATDVQAAIDEVVGDIPTIPATYDADDIVYDNTTSGLTATDAQAAIDEVASTVGELSEKNFQYNTLWSGDASTAGSVEVSDLSKYDALMIYYNSGNGSGIVPYGFFKTHVIKVNYTDGTNVTSASATYVDDTHITLGASQGSTVFIVGIKFHA